MKTRMRLIALLLVFALTFTLAAAGCKKEGSSGGSVTLDEQVTMKPLTASAESNIFMYNPDRGLRTDLVVYVGDLVQYANDEQELLRKLQGIFSIYFGQLEEPCSIAFAYIYITPWNREDLSPEAITVIEQIFEYCRIRKFKLMVNFAYNQDYATPWYNSEANKQEMASQCADEETILRHIDQLAPVIAEYKDCIFSIKNGFIGFVGEWAYPYQYPEVNYDKITKAIVDKLCAPNELYFSHRLPRYTDSVKKAYPTWENVKWIGFNNCAFYGEQTNSGWASEDFQVGDRDGWWEYVCNNGAYTPVTGEMYTSEALNRYNAIVTGQQAILELAHHWHVTFSFWHGKYDCSKSSGYINVMETWERQDINKEWLDANSIIYDPNWFVDDNGNEVSRNCYEFIRDHLGYKLVASNLGIKAGDGKMTVSMDFKNYGTSAAFNLTSGFAILNDRYQVVAEVAAGDPTKWYSHDPENYKSNVVLDHSISGELATPTEAGTYYVAFYLKNSQGVGARLSNEVTFENEHNILFQFTVK